MKKVFLLVMVSLMVLSTYVSIATASALCITVKTSKPSYYVLEEVHVYGNLTYNGSPLPAKLVTIEVEDPSNDTILVETLQTDAEGAYNLTFRLPSTAKLGTYTVHVASSCAGKTATNRTTFEAILPGDVDGDGKVEIVDLILLLKAYCSHPSHPRWNPNADINGDGIVDIQDMTLIIKYYGIVAP